MVGAAALHCVKFLMGFEPAATQTTAAERRLLARYARDASRLLEIGVYEGASTRITADAMPSMAVLYAVDPFFRGRLGICWSEVIARREAKKSRTRSVRFVRAMSTDAARRIHGDFDYIFVDADHSLEAIRADWETWSPRCVVGGVMAFHDTRVASHAPQIRGFGSFQFYNSVISSHPDFREIDAVDTLSIVRRLR
jgi:predicted O-methyltransferase YrrM